MNVRELIERYYRHANEGDWASWCDLFAEDAVVDEQMAGRITGAETLRSMMAGFPAMYPSFANEARRVLIDGDQAAVVSHITAKTASGQVVESDVMNYFEVRGGRIAYMANYHDTVPFRRGLDS
jgi:steroid delta-isomerase-like uncharacterized protein